MQSMSLNLGDVIIQEGAKDEKLYYLQQGKLQVKRGGRMLTILQGECFFGYLALILHIPRTATVVAVETSTVKAYEGLTDKALFGAFAKEPRLLEKFVHDMASAWKESEQVRDGESAILTERIGELEKLLKGLHALAGEAKRQGMKYSEDFIEYIASTAGITESSIGDIDARFLNNLRAGAALRKPASGAAPKKDRPDGGPRSITSRL